MPVRTLEISPESLQDAAEANTLEQFIRRGDVHEQLQRALRVREMLRNLELRQEARTEALHVTNRLICELREQVEGGGTAGAAPATRTDSIKRRLWRWGRTLLFTAGSILGAMGLASLLRRAPVSMPVVGRPQPHPGNQPQQTPQHLPPPAQPVSPAGFGRAEDQPASQDRQQFLQRLPPELTLEQLGLLPAEQRAEQAVKRYYERPNRMRCRQALWAIQNAMLAWRMGTGQGQAYREAFNQFALPRLEALTKQWAEIAAHYDEQCRLSGETATVLRDGQRVTDRSRFVRTEMWHQAMLDTHRALLAFDQMPSEQTLAAARQAVQREQHIFWSTTSLSDTVTDPFAPNQPPPQIGSDQENEHIRGNGYGIVERAHYLQYNLEALASRWQRFSAQ